MSKWLIKKRIKNIEQISNILGVHKPLAYSLALKGIKSKKEAEEFINSINSDFEDIKNLKDVTLAFDIIIEEIKKDTQICVYGDYDADGVLSTTILSKALAYLGANVTYFIPDRVEDGYGLSNSSVVNIYERGVGLIITCDNGIASLDEITLANKLGMKVIVLDHHEPKFTETDGVKTQILPSAEAVIDAKIENCGYSFSLMCAGGLCYRFSKGLFEYMNEDFSPLDDELLTFAGIATICDVVDLVGENRVIAQKALKLINTSVSNVGLDALIKIKNLETITSYHIGFIIGPCINASGRLDSAAIAVDLFLTENMANALEKARTLSDINDERKDLTQKGVDMVLSEIGEKPKDKILVIYNETIHESIAGIIAGRVREAYNRPAIILTNAKEGLKGSARSIEKYDIFKGLYENSSYLTTFGGHTMAAGLSLKKENLEKFRESINKSCKLNEDDLVETIRIVGQLNLEDITEEAVDELSCLSPFGKANETPVYGVIGVQVVSLRFIGSEGQYVKTVLRDSKGYEVSAIDFNNYDKWISIIKDEGYTVETAQMAKPYIDLVFNLDINEYNGYRNPQIRIKDIRKH
ncbi:MAG: single-stranded-DNA-specific exonuclease RecJ [Lachnospirales bacterium]